MLNEVPKSIKLKGKLKECQGYKITNKINQFYLTYYIFNKNFIDLTSLIEKQIEPKNSIRLRESANRKELESLQFETIRLLHNYIAAALSLIDHTRIFVNELYDTDKNFLKEYQDKIHETFINDPLCVFVKSFRQYVQHFQTPLISTVTNLTDKPELLNTRITISKEMLLSFSGWKSLAKAYIDSLNKELDVYEMAINYNEVVKTFYNWFQKRQLEIHKSEFEEMHNIKERLFDAEIEELLFTYINYEECTTSYFIRELVRYMPDIEKKIFLDSLQNDQLNYIYSIAEKKNIALTRKQKTKLKLKYSR
jgi:hypothetical protein